MDSEWTQNLHPVASHLRLLKCNPCFSFSRLVLFPHCMCDSQSHITLKRCIHSKHSSRPCAVKVAHWRPQFQVITPWATFSRSSKLREGAECQCHEEGSSCCFAEGEPVGSVGVDGCFVIIMWTEWVTMLVTYTLEPCSSLYLWFPFYCPFWE